MEEKKSGFINWIETARGIGILLVVFGHAIADIMPNDAAMHNIFVFIYSFHMPLFFFISGYVGIGGLNQYRLSDKVKYWKKRFKRLMIPYFIVGLLYVPIKITLAKFATAPVILSDVLFNLITGTNPNFQLWTLYALFVSSVCITFFSRDKMCGGGYYRPALLVISTVCGIVSTFMPSGILKSILFEFFFYAIGCICRKEKIFEKRYPISSSFISLVILIAVNRLFEVNENTVIKLLTGILGITFVVILCINIQTKKDSIINTIGKYGMDIYIFANLVQVVVRICYKSISAINPYVMLVASVAFGIIIPMILSRYFIRKSTLLSMLFLGEMKRV